MVRTIQLTAVGRDSFPLRYAQQETREKVSDRVAMRMLAREWISEHKEFHRYVSYVLLQWFTAGGRLRQIAFYAYDLNLMGDVK